MRGVAWTEVLPSRLVSSNSGVTALTTEVGRRLARAGHVTGHRSNQQDEAQSEAEANLPRTQGRAGTQRELRPLNACGCPIMNRSG
jgi:hypothetical protein